METMQRMQKKNALFLLAYGTVSPMHIRMYEKLIVWKEAHKLCLRVYEVTVKFPSDEKFGLISQMRRSSYGVPMNTVEGNARRSKKEKVHFIDIAIASLEELHYQCILARDLKYLTVEIFNELDDRIQRVGYLLNKLRSSLL